MMSFIGNLAGVTTQAAFVESMIVVFAGGKTGLSAVVAGASYGQYSIPSLSALRVWCGPTRGFRFQETDVCVMWGIPLLTPLEA